MSATTPHTGPAETVDVSVRTRDSSVAFQFKHFETLGLRKTDLASLKASLQKGLSPGSLLDLGSPTSRGFYQRRPALVGRGHDEYFFWVDVGGKPWHFKCMELLKSTPTQSAGAGGCLAVMRSFNASIKETPTAPTGTVQDIRSPVSPAATPSASTPLPSGSSSGSRPTPTATGASSSPPQTPSSQPHPGEAGSVRLTTTEGFSVELPAGWQLSRPGWSAQSRDGRQTFQNGGGGALVLRSIPQLEKNPRYQSFKHPQGRVLFQTGVKGGGQYPWHLFSLELDGHGWSFTCTAPTDLCMSIAKSARYATPTRHTAQRDAGASPGSVGASGQPRTTGPWHPPAASSPTPRPAQPPERPSQPNVTPSSSAPAPSNPSTAASFLIVAELSKDSRLTSLPADTRELVLSFIRDAYQQCATSEMGNVYDCGCFARLLLDARFRAGTETTGGVSEGRIGRIGRPDFKVSSTTVLFDVKNTQSSSCIVPAQVEKYASDLATAFCRRGLTRSESRALPVQHGMLDRAS